MTTVIDFPISDDMLDRHYQLQRMPNDHDAEALKKRDFRRAVALAATFGFILGLMVSGSGR